MKMAKRTVEDAELATASTSKKVRKEKKSEDVDAVTVPGAVDLKEALKEKKRLKKLKKAAAAAASGNAIEDPAVSNNVVEAGPEPSEGDSAAARKAEKAKAKALKKEKKEKKQMTENAPEPVAEVKQATPVVQRPSASPSSSNYVEAPELKGLPQATIDSFLADNFITITDPLSATNVLRPLIDFAHLPITDPAQRAPFKDFKAPTPIQAAAWPFLLAGRDVIGVAETGSGKTMAFAVPCIRYINNITKGKKTNGVKAVVVSPTRELAMQSHEQITKLAGVAGLQVVCVYGGVPKDEQRRALKTADIVVATPGRLNDLINEGCADLSKVGYVVLDEADRMLDKGFEEEIRKIINTTPPTGKRQTLMFTATWPESVRALASTFMTSPIKIAIGDNPTGDLRANSRIVQKVEVVDPRGKEYRLIQLLKQYQSGAQKDDRIIVFCLYKKEATRVEGFLRQKGIRVGGIHGDLSQEQRTRSLDAFKAGTTPVLVATDVAARGLDIPAVKLVINCTFPLTVEDYVHRIGRTGRAGKEGLAITLFTEHDKAQSGA